MTELSMFAKLSLFFTTLRFLLVFITSVFIAYKRLGGFPPHRHDLRTFFLISISLAWVLVCFALIINPTLINLMGVISILMNNSNHYLFVFLGILFAISGVILLFLAFTEMETSFRMGIPSEEEDPAPLITSGIFKYLRNPGFLGYDLGAIGTFLFAPSLILFIIVVTICIVFHFQILEEEKYLAKVHGETYLKYLNSVGRYFPKISSL